MTLEKVIKDFEETVEECNRVADTQKFDEGDSINNWYRKKADYSQQVAEWLKDYKRLKEQGLIFDKIRTEIRKKMQFNSFNEGYVLYDDIIEVLDKIREVVREAEDDKT
jgi:hypothetical protein